MTDEHLNELLERARNSERTGRIADAREALLDVASTLRDRDRLPQYLYHWLALLELELGHLDLAIEATALGRAIAVEAGAEDAVFRMDVLRAGLARSAHDLEQAEARLAALRSNDSVLGPVRADRRPEIAAWLRDLQFPGARQPLAVMRYEAVLAIAHLWSDRGRYVSALDLLDTFGDELAIAGTFDSAEVTLFSGELEICAGRFEQARARLATLAGSPLHRQPRVAIANARLALTTGRIADAIASLPLLETVPTTDPGAFAAATAVRVAIQCELNFFETAVNLATTALVHLREASADAIELLERASADALARSRSVVRQWELPYVIGSTARALPLTFEPPSSQTRFTSRWTGLLNEVISRLDVGDLVAARAAQALLEQVSAGVESEYVASRVQVSGALIRYFAGDDALRSFLEAANKLRGLGARLAEAQAIRFAAWAAARRRDHDAYKALSLRNAELVDAAASELEPAHRAAFMMNKWNGRDERVALQIGEVLRGPSPPKRRKLCQTFREIEEITHWPIVDALRGSNLAAEAASNLVGRWVMERQSTKVDLRGGVEVGSLWDLWWFPARTLVLHYHVLPDRTYLFAIARRRIELSILPIGRIHLTETMSQLVSRAEDMKWLAEHTGIVAALRRFPAVKRLVIVPDAMASIPFAALRVDDKPLCAHMPIVFVDRLARLQRRPRLPPHGKLLSFGRTDYGASLPSLAYAEEEATEIATLGGGEARPAATCQQLERELVTAGRAHVAAHGIFDATDPSKTGIVLGDENGGIATITLRQLRSMNLHKLRLATLATCDSAEHARLPGHERICLPTAFLDAGAHGVIASLWAVNDAGSVPVMKSLYSRLRNRPASLALAETQIALAEQGVAAKDWAGLTFYGND